MIQKEFLKKPLYFKKGFLQRKTKTDITATFVNKNKFNLKQKLVAFK